MANTYEYEIVSVEHDGEMTEAEVRSAAARKFFSHIVEGVALVDDEWLVRLAKPVKAGDAPPWLQKKKDDAGADDTEDDDDAAESDDDKDPDGDGDDDTDPAKDTDDDAGTKPTKGDPVKQIQQLLNQVQKLFGDLKDKADKVDEIHDSIKDHVGDDDAMPGEEGPMPPGAGDADMPPGKTPPVPRGPRPSLGPSLGEGGGQRGLPLTFTNRSYVVKAAKVAEDGQSVSLSQALAELEQDEEHSGYRVESVSDEGDKWAAKLVLRS